MRVNIEQLKKKDSVESIDFDFTVTSDQLDDEYLIAIGAEEVEFVRVYGDISVKDINSSIIAINYKIDTKFTARCARCDEIITQELYTEGEKFLADNNKNHQNEKNDNDDADEAKEDDESFYMVESNIVNLVDFAMEFLELEAPLRYLCDEDCKGLCQKCGKNLNEGECGCPTKEKNPAFKVLDNFFN